MDKELEDILKSMLENASEETLEIVTENVTKLRNALETQANSIVENEENISKLNDSLELVTGERDRIKQRYFDAVINGDLIDEEDEEEEKPKAKTLTEILKD